MLSFFYNKEFFLEFRIPSLETPRFFFVALKPSLQYEFLLRTIDFKRGEMKRFEEKLCMIPVSELMSTGVSYFCSLPCI